MFLLIISSIWGAAHWYVGRQLIRPLDLSSKARRWAWAAVVLVWALGPTTFVTGLAALTGLHAWPAPRPRYDEAFSALFTPAERAAWERPDTLAAIVPNLERTIARLVRGGGRVGVGSDAPAVPYGLGVHLELALLARAGIPNDQILRMATAAGALALGAERDIGTLEEGKLADFVVLDGDPLTHIADTLRIVAVVKGGVWYDRAALLTPP